MTSAKMEAVRLFIRVLVLAWEAFASEEGLLILSNVNTDRRGGPFSIMHPEVKPAFAILD